MPESVVAQGIEGNLGDTFLWGGIEHGSPLGALAPMGLRVGHGRLCGCHSPERQRGVLVCAGGDY